MEHVVVVGAGVGGLTTALALGRAGRRVTLLERDTLPATADAEQAFEAERHGAPQVHQTHGFLARIVVELRERFPDVLDDLFAAGCTTMPSTANLGEARPGDEDLKVLVVRRTTFEWVLREAVVACPGIEVRTGARVAGLSSTEPRVVDSVRLDDGSRIAADIVVACTGRRGPLLEWLAECGAHVPETVVESGLMYLSRWYRLSPEQIAALEPKLGGDLGFVKYLAVPGDANTLSVTLAIRPDDKELRIALSDPDRFEDACRVLPGPDQFFRRRPLEACGGMRPMSGLLNRIRRFVDDDGRPAVLGFHAVGDAHTCTNPLYGRGCSLAVVQAIRLADAVAAHPADATGRALAYEDACAREIEPWYHASVEMDRQGADPSGNAAGEGNKAMRAVFVAAATDPVLGRAFARHWNLLALPAEMATDPEVVKRMAEVMQNPDAYPSPPRVGPTREELLASLKQEVS